MKKYLAGFLTAVLLVTGRNTSSVVLAGEHQENYENVVIDNSEELLLSEESAGTDISVEDTGILITELTTEETTDAVQEAETDTVETSMTETDEITEEDEVTESEDTLEAHVHDYNYVLVGYKADGAIVTGDWNNSVTDIGIIFTCNTCGNKIIKRISNPNDEFETSIYGYNSVKLHSLYGAHVVNINYYGEPNSVSAICNFASVNYVLIRGTVNVDSLNIRSGPGTKYATCGTLKSGNQVEIRYVENGWGAINNSNQEWVKLEYLTNLTTSSTDLKTNTNQGSTMAPYQVKVTASSLNVRQESSSASTRVGEVKNGEVLTVYDVYNGWGLVEYSGFYAWINLSYTQKTSTGQGGSSSVSGSTESQTSGTASENRYIVTASSLNIRSGPGTDYSRLGSLYMGDKVTAVSEKDNWVKFVVNGSYGWVSKDYLKAESSPSGASQAGSTSATVKTKYQVNASSLNVRSGAGTSYSRIGSLNRGSIIEAISEQNGWVQIIYNGSYGWVSKDYLKTENGGSTTGTTGGGGSQTTTKTYFVTADVLNVRSDAGTSYSVIGSLSNKATLVILEEKGEWGRINFDGKTGWVCLRYVKIQS